MVAVCLLYMLCNGLGRRGDKAKNKVRIEKCQMCIHKMDINGALNCIAPDDEQEIRLLLEALPMISSETPEDQTDSVAEGLYKVMDLLVENCIHLQEFDNRTALAECLKNVSIQAVMISKSPRRTNDQALVNCVGEINLNGETVTTRVEINMVKSDGQWYIDMR